MPQLKENVTRSSERISLHNFLQSMYEHNYYFTSRSVLPVNNFLKDFSQIENELSQEINKGIQFMTLNGIPVPVDQVLMQQMEENY